MAIYGPKVPGPRDHQDVDVFTVQDSAVPERRAGCRDLPRLSKSRSSRLDAASSVLP